MSLFAIGLCVLCSEWCYSAVCKLCCVRNWMGLSNMLIFMLNCKWQHSMGYCDILSDHCLFCCTIWPFSSLSFIFACLCSLLYSHSWGYWGWKRYDQSPCAGQRSVVCGWASESVLWVCLTPSLHIPKWVRVTDSSSLSHIPLFFSLITRTDVIVTRWFSHFIL